MKHHTSRSFRDGLAAAPEAVRAQAQQAFEMLRRDPRHPSLQLKRVGKDGLWSVRANRSFRELGDDVEGGILWFWFGEHAVYEQMISGRRG